MRVKVFGPLAGYAPAPGGGQAMRSWAPNEVVEVDDGDETGVEFYRGLVASGAAELVDEARGEAFADQPATTQTSEPAEPAEPVHTEQPEQPERPAGNASKADWVGWAEDRGVDAEVAESMTRDELRDLAEHLDAGTATIVDGDVRYG